MNEPRLRDDLPILLDSSGEKQTFGLTARHAQHLNSICDPADLPRKLAALDERCTSPAPSTWPGAPCAGSSAESLTSRERGPGGPDALLTGPRAGTTVGRVLLTAQDAALLLVDLQQRLVPALHDGETVVARAARLAEAARLLDVPIGATEQNPAGLGPTVAPLAAFPQLTVDKTAFSATGAPGFPTLLPPGTAEVVVAGCEAHVCVLQTVAGLQDAGYRVVVVADAVGSRDPADASAALERMARHGAEVVTSEMVLFEWLRDAAHPHFRAVQKLLR